MFPLSNGVLIQYTTGLTDKSGNVTLTFPLTFNHRRSIMISAVTDVKNASWNILLLPNPSNRANIAVTASLTGYNIYVEALCLGD